jgi:hypothetical protein
MQRPLGEHINRLEERLKLLNERVMENALSREERNRTESEIRIVSLALSQYRDAFKLEQSILVSN